MKILIADFEIAKYGGIVEHIEAKVKAFKSLGHDIDLVKFTPSSTTQKRYDDAVKKFESGEFQNTKKLNSQNGGYELSKATGYWKNNYYGYFLPPSNRIGVFEKGAVERWLKMTEDVDLVIWNFMPTKSSSWNKADFSFWWKFYDLPKTTSQIFVVHDAYFDVRASNISALKKKILFLECAHVAAYHCCENIGIRRTLLLNPRYMKNKMKMTVIPFSERETDFFAAHIFKSMKRVDDLIRAIPYFNHDSIEDDPRGEFSYSIKIAGSGIEQAYMVATDKIKPNYVCNKKLDPDLPDYRNGLPIWEVGEYHGMQYLGQISSYEVNAHLYDSKFAIDPSWASHYAQYCNTHINGFIIEAMLRGCYPVLRDYRGLSDKEVEDPLFDNIRAIYIPWNATPKQFAKALRKAYNKMTDEKYLEDTLHNFELVKTLFNAKENAKEVVRLVEGGRKLVKNELEKGVDSDNVKRITEEIMTDFFKIELPIIWEN